VNLAINSGLMWETDPGIRVCGPHAGFSGEYSKAENVIQINRGVATSFENNASNQAYRNAFEMSLLHELLHGGISSVAGEEEHGQFWNDPVNDFERRAYFDREIRHKTLGKIAD